MLKLDTTTVLSLAVSALQSTVWQVQTLNRCAERVRAGKLQLCREAQRRGEEGREGQGEMPKLV